MITDAALIERREELKRRLATGEYKTLVDVLFDSLSNIIQKITRNPQPISPWYSSAIIYLTIVLIFLGNASVITGRFASLILQFFLSTLLAGYLSIVIMLIGNTDIHRVFTTFRDSVLDTVESIASVNDFENWLIRVCNRKVHLMIAIIASVLWGISNLSLLRSFTVIPVSLAIAILLLQIGHFAFLYLFFYMILLAIQIGRYDLKLYTGNPASSEVISRLSGMLINPMYLFSIYATYFTVLSARYAKIGAPYMVWIIPLFVWIPIIVIFVFNQRSLSAIIKRAKWKTLNDVQGKVERLQATENYGDKETMEAVNRLMDYHDRIVATRNSALDLRATLNFVNSLLLPLLVFILGNLDLVLKLFGVKP